MMKLANALDTTPDTFLVGCARYHENEWRDVAELLRGMDGKKLALAKNFLNWLAAQEI